MTGNPHFVVDDQSLSAESRELLAEQRRKFGFVANPLARAAVAPATLGAMLAMLERFEHSSLAPAEREVVAFALAYENGCGYCMALHSALAQRVPAIAEHVSALRQGERPGDARLGALWDFVRALLTSRGAASEAELEAFRRAGYSDENALDVVLGVGAYTLTTFANRLVGAPLDPPFERFRWSPPQAA